MPAADQRLPIVDLKAEMGRYLPSGGWSVDIVGPWTEARRSSDYRKVRPPGREKKWKEKWGVGG